MTTKSFHIGDVLSITDGKLVSPDHIGGVYNILNWMTGESLMTHQLPRVSLECKPYLAEQFPELAKVVVPAGINSEAAALAYLETLYEHFGTHVEVAPLPEIDHTSIDPIAEIKMTRPDAVIVDL
jgi:hypothetical protein